MTRIAAVEPTSLSIVLAASAVLGFSFLIRRIFFYKPLRLPPGPRPLPIVGNFLQLIFGGDRMNLIGKWIQKHGPIVTIWLCSKCIIVVSDPDIAEEALMGLGHQLASRNLGGFGMRHLKSIGFRMLSITPYSDYWRSARKNLASHVLTKGSRRALQPIREEEIELLVGELRAEAREGAAAVPLGQHLRLASCAIFFRACFSKSCDKSTLEELNKTLEALHREIGFQWSDFLPFLAPFVVHKQKKRLEQVLDKLENIFGHLIVEQRELRKSGHTAPTYLDNVLDLQEEIGLSENEVLALLTELHMAGTDTTATTTVWTLGELTANPQVQDKLFQEIMQVVGKRPITEDDIPNLPYLKAVVEENFRKHPPLPSLITHSPVGQGVKLAGYDIPECAEVVISVKKIQNDPRVWSDPEKFNPERFFVSDGQFMDQMAASKGGKLSKIFPFGAGRRICPGMMAGLTNVHFLVARLIQAFEFLPVDPQKGVDLTETGTELVLFKTPLYLILRDR